MINHAHAFAIDEDGFDVSDTPDTRDCRKVPTWLQAVRNPRGFSADVGSYRNLLRVARTLKGSLHRVAGTFQEFW
jgi:hypothetical protein